MKNTFVIFCLFLFVLSNCSKESNFPYIEQLTGYLDEVQKINIRGETIIIIVTGSCGSCEDRTLKFVEEIVLKKEFKNVKKYIVFPNNHEESVKRFENKGFNVILDKDFKLSRYGLDFDKNLLVHLLDSDRIKYWEWMYMEKFFNIGKEYDIVDL